VPSCMEKRSGPCFENLVLCNTELHRVCAETLGDQHHGDIGHW
jgi:hypothetical protein